MPVEPIDENGFENGSFEEDVVLPAARGTCLCARRQGCLPPLLPCLLRLYSPKGCEFGSRLRRWVECRDRLCSNAELCVLSICDSKEASVEVLGGIVPVGSVTVRTVRAVPPASHVQSCDNLGRYLKQIARGTRASCAQP